MTRLLLATNNSGKVLEMRELLSALDVELVTPRQLRIDILVEESGKSYAENAEIKARAYARDANILTLADDSGLEVDALGGAPGLQSARYASIPNATDAHRRLYLLKNLRGKPHPWNAKFRCVVAIFSPLGGTIRFTEGVCPGEIISEERGRGGFGYDPIFFIPELGCTMAEMSMQDKNRLSHRARAVRKAIPILSELLSKLSS